MKVKDYINNARWVTGNGNSIAITTTPIKNLMIDMKCMISKELKGK